LGPGQLRDVASFQNLVRPIEVTGKVGATIMKVKVSGGNTKGYSAQHWAGLKRRASMTYTVIYEKGPASWGAYVPDLPGVISVGDSRDEVERVIQEAIQFHVEGMREEGVPIPAASSFAGLVEIDPAA